MVHSKQHSKNLLDPDVKKHYRVTYDSIQKKGFMVHSKEDGEALLCSVQAGTVRP
jgi:hypothetical protein